jgi:uncharacterized membrane protein YgaE (UPF0421/DUF939 family)
MDVPIRRVGVSLWDVFHAVEMAIACLISYWIVTVGLARFVDRPDDLLGGMWAVVATIFVFRENRGASLAAGISRLSATCVSFALCLAYLSIFPFTAPGMATLLALGTLIMAHLGRRDDIVTTGITTAVVMVVAALSPHDAWRQPLLRLLDTVVGIGGGVCCEWVASWLFFRITGETTR